VRWASLPFSQDQNYIEHQQNHQADIRGFLNHCAAEAFINSVICDPENEKHIPDDGKIFEESVKANIFHFGISKYSTHVAALCFWIM
jgi:hypothetical protein